MSQCVVARGSAFTLGDFQTFRSTAQIFVDSARRLSPELVAMPPFERLQAAVDHGEPATTGEQHGLVCAFLDGLKEASHRTTSPENYSFVAKCTEYDSHIDKVARHFRANARSQWPKRLVKSENNDAIALAIDEIVAHVRGFAAPSSPFDNFAAYTQMRLSTLVPPEVAGMRQETNISLILPFFEKSLSVPGDAAEFGCFRGVLSVKLAWMLKVMGGQRHYYTFDTFGGFEIADPAGGALGVGAFSDNADAYNYLTQWSRVLPLTPVRGDATKTCAVLTKPLSFVWLDLDMAVLMDPVLRQIWHLCGPDTIIGVDDVGRPETPTVAPWLDDLIKTGVVDLVFNSDETAPNTFIRVLRKKADFPAPIGIANRLRSLLWGQRSAPATERA
jgi:hypothetical protein